MTGEHVNFVNGQVLERGTNGIASAGGGQDHGALNGADMRPESGRRNVLSKRKHNAESVKLAGIFGQMARGEHTALAGCYDLMGPVVFSLAVRMLRDRGAAEDVTQDIFVQVWRQAGNFDRARGTPEAWVMMIARTRILDRIRSRRAGVVLRQAAEQMPEAPDADDWPDDLAISREEAACVRRALMELPAEQREVVEMAFFDGLTHQEIAEKTSVALGTIKTRIRLGLLKIKDRLRGVMGDRAEAAEVEELERQERV